MQVHLEGPHGAEVITADALLVAIGREPNSDLLNVAATGVTTDADGFVVVDDYQRTSVEGIYALGDISSPYALKHVANHEARVVRHNTVGVFGREKAAAFRGHISLDIIQDVAGD